MKKSRYWKLLALGALIMALLMALLQWMATDRFTSEEIVKRLEASRNCRASVEKASVRLFAFPARLEVHGLKVVPREDPNRLAMPDETIIAVDHMLLEVNIWSLLFGELDVNRAILDGLVMKSVKWEQGGNSMRQMLNAPGAAGPASPPGSLEDEDEIPPPPEELEKPFHISELPVSASLREARIRNASWNIRNDRRHTVTQIKDFNAVLTGIHLDPANPAAGGDAAVSVRGRYILDTQRFNTRTIDFIIALDGKYQIFDPATGSLNNDLAFQVTVKKGSIVNRLPTLVKLNERLAKLKPTIGLNLELPPEGTLLGDTVIQARLKDGVVRLSDDVLFPFDTYQISLNKESWLSVRDEQHVFEGQLIANSAITASAMGGLKEFITKRSPGLSDLISKTVLDKIVSAQGNIVLPFKSTDQIGHPNVTLSEKFEDALTNALKEAGKELLKDTLEGGKDLNNILDALKNSLKKEKGKPGKPPTSAPSPESP